MIAACNFISLGEKLRELLDKNGERDKKRRKITDRLIGQKRRNIYEMCRSVSRQS